MSFEEPLTAVAEYNASERTHDDDKLSPTLLSQPLPRPRWRRK